MMESRNGLMAVALTVAALWCAAPPAVASSPACSNCAGDLTNDGVVGVPDLLELLACWGEVVPGSECDCADLTGSGGVGVADLLGLLAAWGECPVPVCGHAESGSCCSQNQSPGCDNAECCEAVCACDPFCCNVQWDIYCVTGGFDPACMCGPGQCGVMNTPECAYCLPDPVCAEMAGAPGADCCAVHDGIGCNEPICCETVCDINPSCCTVQWTWHCVGLAMQHCAVCPGCGHPDAGSCCESNGSPACDDTACCQAVCACDPFCCEVQWDGFCVSGGFDPDCLCGPGGCGVVNTPECDHLDCFTPPCEGASGDCCTSNGSIGCEVPECCECVCGQDPFCCDVMWDSICAGRAAGVCDDHCNCSSSCGEAGTGSCCSPWTSSPSCEDKSCCETVCAIEPECCSVNWTISCIVLAYMHCDVCAGCGDPDAGSCCGGTTSPFCDNLECCAVVCACDPFCCDVQWDQFCASGGFDADCLCGPGMCGGANYEECAYCRDKSECDIAIGDCCTSNGSIGCEVPECCECVCAQDPFCCDVEWDSLCAGRALDQCCDSCLCCEDDSGGPADCCTAHGGVGCPQNPECETCVCGQDPFCCDVEWDSLCAWGAQNVCADACCEEEP